MSLSFCTKNDDDNSTDNPIDPVENPALQNELVAPANGWKLTYNNPDNEHGAYQFLLKFNVNGEVAMLSDIEETTTPTTSRYVTSQEDQGLVLSFIGQNKLHLLADAIKGNAAEGLTGKVYQFLYTGKEGNNLKFKNLLKASQPTLTFEPASADDWTKIPAASANLIEFAEFNKLGSFYYLTINQTASTTVYHVTYDNRVLSLQNTSVKTDVYPTEKGIGFSGGLTIDGVTFTELERLSDTSPVGYRGSAGGATADLRFSFFPVNEFNKDDYQHINTQIKGVTMLSQLLQNSKYFTQTFYQDVLQLNNNTALYSFAFNFLDNQTCQIQIGHRFSGTTTPTYIGIECKYELKNKRLYLKDSNNTFVTSEPSIWNAPNNAAVLAKAQSTLETLYNMGAQGYYVRKLDTPIEPLTTSPAYLFQSYQFPLYVFPAWGVPK